MIRSDIIIYLEIIKYVTLTACDLINSHSVCSVELVIFCTLASSTRAVCQILVYC